jgi:hypothetical protein
MPRGVYERKAKAPEVVAGGFEVGMRVAVGISGTIEKCDRRRGEACILVTYDDPFTGQGWFGIDEIQVAE